MKISSHTLTHSLLAAACALTCLSASAATIKITSRDAAGIGFNDPTPTAPVGGNNGVTLGEQRMNVYRFVADLWEKAIDSPRTIEVSAAWEPLTCDASSAVLGSAGARNIWHDFPGSKPGTWYPQALANKLSNLNLAEGRPDTTGYDNVDIKTQFNINLGNPGCLTGNGFYLGLDGNAGSKVNFATTLLHELGHGLGFSVTSVQTSTGLRINAAGTAFTEDGLPSIWEGFMYDNTTGKSWLNMTSLERKASAINPLKLAWTGANAVAGASLLKPTPVIRTTSSAPGGKANFDYILSAFGPQVIASPSALGALATYTVQANDAAPSGPGCNAFNAANIAAVTGKVAIISRGGCAFNIKVMNAQLAGAVGVLLANNVDDVNAIQAPGGANPAVTIPSAGISRASGDALNAAVLAARPYGTRTRPGSVTASWNLDPTRIAGADFLGRPLLYTPATLAPGSSVSHWDVTASPNLLMEPSINADLTNILVPPKDLTVPLLKDIGW